MTEAPLQGFGRWSDVIGHGRVLSALRHAVAGGRPHHAYLLLGPQGIGKKTIAKALCSALLCDRGEAEPCGTCPSCHKLQQGMHTGVTQVLPGGKANQIGVDAIAEIQRQLSYRRLEGAWRVVLIDDCGQMNDSAQNKLLKTLEEPPEGTVLVLTALHPGQLLQTVRSRCQKLGLGVVPQEAIQRWLIAQHGATHEAAHAAATGSRGVPGRALELLDPETGGELLGRVSLLGRALDGDAPSIAEATSMVDRDKLACAEMLVLLQELLRDAMVRAAGGRATLAHPSVELTGPLARLSARALAEHALRIEDVQEKLTRNVHPGGLVEVLLHEMTGA